jgi:hypothetical protein
VVVGVCELAIEELEIERSEAANARTLIRIVPPKRTKLKHTHTVPANQDGDCPNGVKGTGERTRSTIGVLLGICLYPYYLSVSS